MIMSHIRSRQPWTLERLVTKCSISLGFALDKSTSLAYSSALNSYLAFCSMHGFDPEPLVDTLSFYVTYVSHHIEPWLVHMYLTGIVSELEPFYSHIREIHQSSVVACTLKGALRQFSSLVRQKELLTQDNLVAVATSLPQLPSHDDLLFCALLQTGFFGLNRLGELVWLDSIALQTYSKVLWRSSVQLLPTSYSFDIRRDKVDVRVEGSKVVIHQSNMDPDPLNTFTCYLRSCDTLSPSILNFGLEQMPPPQFAPGFFAAFTAFFLDPSVGTPCELEGLPLSLPLEFLPPKYKQLVIGSQWPSSVTSSSTPQCFKRSSSMVTQSTICHLLLSEWLACALLPIFFSFSSFHFLCFRFSPLPHDYHHPKKKTSLPSLCTLLQGSSLTHNWVLPWLSKCCAFESVNDLTLVLSSVSILNVTQVISRGSFLAGYHRGPSRSRDCEPIGSHSLVHFYHTSSTHFGTLFIQLGAT